MNAPMFSCARNIDSTAYHRATTKDPVSIAANIISQSSSDESCPQPILSRFRDGWIDLMIISTRESSTIYSKFPLDISVEGGLHTFTPPSTPSNSDVVYVAYAKGSIKIKGEYFHGQVIEDGRLWPLDILHCLYMDDGTVQVITSHPETATNIYTSITPFNLYTDA